MSDGERVLREMESFCHTETEREVMDECPDGKVGCLVYHTKTIRSYPDRGEIIAELNRRLAALAKGGRADRKEARDVALEERDQRARVEDRHQDELDAARGEKP